MTQKPMKPIIKWPGGKEKELSHIKSNAPETFMSHLLGEVLFL